MPQCAQCGHEIEAAPEGAANPVCSECRRKPVERGTELPHPPPKGGEWPTRGQQEDFIVTNLLLAINIGIWVWMVLHRVSLTSASSDQIIHWGGNYGPLTLGTEPWRLVTALFLHIGIFHLAANMWALFVLGRLAESLYGRWTYLSTYLLAGIGGSIASMLWNPMGVSAGASGAIFGVVGALIATFFVGKLPLPKENRRYILVTLVVFAGFDLIYGLWKAGVDNAAHIGGLTIGLMLGAALGHHLGSARPARVLRERVLLGAVMFVFLFAVVVWGRNGYVTDVERARMLIGEGAVAEGLRELQVAANRRPNEPYILLLMGDAYVKKGDFPKAEAAYKRITELRPQDPIGWSDLAGTYAAEKKFAESAATWVKLAGVSKASAPAAWFNAGQIYMQMDKDEEAVNAYQKAAELAPGAVEFWAALGFAQLKAGQNQQAATTLEKAVKMQPANPDLRLILGNAYLAAGDQNRAQEQFFQASKLRQMIEQRMRQMQEKRGQATAPQNGNEAPAKK